jgi:hypothetical protein
MNKTIAVIAATLAAAASFAAEYHWRGNAPDMTANGKSGNWADASNWTDASGNAVADYPHVAGDVAVFHGMAMGGYVNIQNISSLVLDELRFSDGNSTIVHDNNIPVTVGRLVVADGAVFGIASDYFRGTMNFTIGNRNEVIVNDTGLVKGGMAYRSAGEIGMRGSLSVNTDGKFVVTAPDEKPAIWVDGDTTNDSALGVFFGAWANANDLRGIHFNFYSHMSDVGTYTVPCGLLVPMGDHDTVGRYVDSRQGRISTGTNGGALYFWTRNTNTAVSDSYFRAKILAPRFVQAAFGTTVMFDDHSEDEVTVYDVVAGTLCLGGDIYSGNENTVVTTTCTMGTGTIEIGWNASLDVACENALNAASTINVKSYNGKKGDFGTINLGYSATVNKLLVDGAELDAGTYGATGSGAANIRDDIFTGTGVLTVTAGEGGDEPPVVVTKPFVIYFE